MKSCVAFVALLWVPAAAATPAAPSERPRGPDHFVIENARLVIGTGDAVAAGDIVMKGGLIIAVGPNAGDSELARGAWVIDGNGKSVYPGLIDGLSSLGLSSSGSGSDETPPYSTGPEDRPATMPWRSAADELDPEDDRLESFRTAGFTSSVSAPSGGIVSGQAAVVNLATDEPRAMVVADERALRVELSPLGGRGGYPGSLMGVMAYVKQLFLDAAHYRRRWDAYEHEPLGQERPRYDRALGPIAAVQASRSPVLLPGHLEHEIVRAVELAKELDLQPVVYGLHQGHAATDYLAAEGVSVLVSTKWPTRDKDADPDAFEPLSVLRLRQSAPTTPAALERASVSFAFYSDGVSAPADVLANVRRAMDAGLSAEGALRAMTLAPATIFGVADRLGSLEVGKIANLIITDGELFDADTTIETVFIDGRKHEPAGPLSPASDEGGQR